MKLESVLFKLREAARIAEEDMELGHMMADAALLEYVNNPKITVAYDEVVKSYEPRTGSDTKGA